MINTMRDLIRILIVDDFPIVRTGLRALIEAEVDMQVVAEAGDGREGVRLFHQHDPTLF